MDFKGTASTSIFTDFMSATVVFASKDPEAGMNQWVRLKLTRSKAPATESL
jgi:hypothetical protein